MVKLNQIVAVVAGKKTRTEKEFGELNKTLQKSDLFAGLTRTYKPLNEDDVEKLQDETKYPQKTVAEILAAAQTALTSIIDAVATQEYGNTSARADVVVEGATIVAGVPITVLLYLEKQLNDLHTFVGNIPVLDPAERWSLDSGSGQYVTQPSQTYRTRKVARALVLYQATKEHPAQTQAIQEDVPAGTWTVTKFSTAIPAQDKQRMLAKIVSLQDAVKSAREQANSIEVEQRHVAAGILSYIFS